MLSVNKQRNTLSVVNNDDLLLLVDKKNGNHKRKHGPLLPNTIRAIICGPSGGGKTNIMLALLLNRNGLKFENVYLYSKSLYQPKYQVLKEILGKIKKIGYYAYSADTAIVTPADAKNNSVIIFDDVACDKQDVMRSYFSMGRHKNIDCFYLGQSYTRIPKHLIRDNSNFLVLLKQDQLNLKHIYQDHVGTDMSFEKFCFICRECWKQKYGFLVISKEDEINNGRYRCGFDRFIDLSLSFTD